MSAGFLCLNCLDERGVPGKVIESDIPVCECGVDGRQEEYKPLIMIRSIIHFDAPHPVIKGKGCNKMACEPKKLAYGDNVFATGHVAAVTCLACKKTDAYKKMSEVQGVPVVPEKVDHVIGE